MRYIIAIALLLSAVCAPAGRPAEAADKSPRVAFLMSLVVPGLGEFYAGAPKRAAIFLGVEAFTWFNYARWRSKGNDLKAEFRTFADQHWNEARYRDWQQYNRAQGSPYNETETLPCKHDAAGCEKVDTQQYYELIGKYDQFVFGWSDVQNVDFSVINTQVQSSLREDYENQRNESNKFLKRASVIIGVAVVNRIVSAIHASAHARSMQIALTPVNPAGRLAPALAIRTQF